MASFPTSIVTPTDPTSGNTLNSPDHAGEHQSHNAEIVAIEAKVGIGASTPVANRLLYGNGTGTSAWTQLTSSQLAASLTDETGSGAAVFGTAPTISAPVVSTGTFASPVLTTPAIVTSINDTNGNEVIKTPATASATNEITVTNAANGTSPTISATGSSDSNIDGLLVGKGTGSFRHAGPYDGWTAANETWTYASATTFTTASAALAAALAVGDKIKLTQTTVKYFYVTGVSGTTITVTGGTDYTLANAAITLPFYSHASTPVGFPDRFSFTPAWINLTPGSGTNTGQFSMSGKSVRLYTNFTFGSGSSVGTAPTVTLPITSSSTNLSSGISIIGSSSILDSGVAQYLGVVIWSSTTSAIYLVGGVAGTYYIPQTITATVPGTWSSNDILTAQILYEAA